MNHFLDQWTIDHVYSEASKEIENLSPAVGGNLHTTPPASSSKIIQEPQQSQQAMLYIYLIPYIDIYRSYILLYICIFATILLTIWPGLEGISTCIDSWCRLLWLSGLWRWKRWTLSWKTESRNWNVRRWKGQRGKFKPNGPKSAIWSSCWNKLWKGLPSWRARRMKHQKNLRYLKWQKRCHQNMHMHMWNKGNLVDIVLLSQTVAACLVLRMKRMKMTTSPLPMVSVFLWLHH